MDLGGIFGIWGGGCASRAKGAISDGDQNGIVCILVVVSLHTGRYLGGSRRAV